MPSLCGSAEATPEWFRAFAAHSFLTCRPLRPRRVRHRYFPELRCRHWPSPNDHRLGTPNTPAIRSTRAVDFVASLVRFRYSLPGWDADLAIMRRLDRLHLELPFAGSRMLQGLLVAEGYKIGRRHVKTLMKRMEIEALYRRPRTTKPEPGKRSTRICCAGWRSRGPTRCGRWTLPTSQWHAGLSIWRLCSIGSAVACCRGAYRSRWRRLSALRP